MTEGDGIHNCGTNERTRADTEWADFNTPGFELRVNWERNVGVELCKNSLFDSFIRAVFGWMVDIAALLYLCCSVSAFRCA
jgi:hypothetical protein|eukprot:COSAG06_NODE_1361_length_9704_cov_16.768974_7_plen_81_part_00